MALDKVIDSGRLDGALQATADAIRAKTGGSDAIPFDGAIGFADAVGAIQSAGASVLPFYTAEVTITSKRSWLDVYHYLNTTKMLVMVEALDLTHSGPYETYRIIMWSPELLAPHVRYPVGDMTTSPYVDETLPTSAQRIGAVVTQSGGATATAHWIAAANRTGTGGSSQGLIFNSPDYVQISPNSVLSIGTYRVTVIDISGAGIRFTEEE